MKELELSLEKLSEEVLLSYKGHNFMVITARGGQYGFERRVIIYIVKDDLEKVHFKIVGILRLFDDRIKKESTSEQCLVIGETNFKDCLDSAKEYIKKNLDFMES